MNDLLKISDQIIFFLSYNNNDIIRLETKLFSTTNKTISVNKSPRIQCIFQVSTVGLYFNRIGEQSFCIIYNFILNYMPFTMTPGINISTLIIGFNLRSFIDAY